MDKMGPLQAFIMGFTFSFAWTPCVGPMLTSILLLASSAKSMYLGNLLVFVYTLGFVIPFIIIGLLSSKVFEFLKARGKMLKYISKLGGIILIIMGIMVYTGWLNSVSTYLNQFGSIESVLLQDQGGVNQESTDGDSTEVATEDDSSEEIVITDEETEQVQEENTDSSQSNETVPIIDFTLTDQNGNEHTLSDYKGKTVFLNFWATGCPPCIKEVPHIIEHYNKYNQNQDDLIIISVVNPGGFLEGDRESIDAFIAEYGINFPVLFDNDGSVFTSYNINSIPTTFLINTDNEIMGYVPGGMTGDMMSSIIEQALGN